MPDECVASKGMPCGIAEWGHFSGLQVQDGDRRQFHSVEPKRRAGGVRRVTREKRDIHVSISYSEAFCQLRRRGNEAKLIVEKGGLVYYVMVTYRWKL